MHAVSSQAKEVSAKTLRTKSCIQRGQPHNVVPSSAAPCAPPSPGTNADPGSPWTPYSVVLQFSEAIGTSQDT